MQDISFEIAKYCDVKRLKVLRQVKPFFVAATRLVTFRYGRTTISTKEVRRIAIHHDFKYFKTYFDNITHLVITGKLKVVKINVQEIMARININTVTNITASDIYRKQNVLNLHVFAKLRVLDCDSSVIQRAENIPSSIEGLHLHGVFIKDITALNNVRELTLDGTIIPDKMLGILGKTVQKLTISRICTWYYIIKYFDNITELCIYFHKENHDKVNALSNQKKLRKLTLIGYGLERKNFKNLINSAQKLEYLEYSNCDISGAKVLKTRNLPS